MKIACGHNAAKQEEISYCLEVTFVSASNNALKIQRTLDLSDSADRTQFQGVCRSKQPRYHRISSLQPSDVKKAHHAKRLEKREAFDWLT